MLSPPSPLRERILSMGAFGTGKTHAWLTIAQWLQRTQSPGKMYAIDSDEAVARMLVPTGQFADLQNVVFREVYEWQEYERAIDEFLPVLTEHDWLVVDFVGKAWDAVQDWYTETIYHQDMAEFFLQARQQMRSGNPLDGWKDWSIINRVYRRFIDKVIHKHPAHVYLTAVVDSVRDTDSAEVRAMFGRHGVRPRAQKHLSHQVHTVLLTQALGDEWFMTTVKDRERSSLAGQQVSDWTIDYLVNTAGWTL